MRSWVSTVLVVVFTTVLGAVLTSSPASGFCGFYVARADTRLFNQASKVVIVRDGDRTVLTMANDYRGEPSEFALVVPVPTFLERGQIHVGGRSVLEHLDAYSAPRLVEYYDRNPCERPLLEMSAPSSGVKKKSGRDGAGTRTLGVTVEARYSVGEYDIAILSAEESRGLTIWLRNNGYRLPEGARNVLADYVRRGMYFFVARVDLREKARLGYSYLRPLQLAFEWEKFMLPIRLGTLNADGPQELFVFVLNRTGRVETANYPTVRLPSDVEVPAFVKDSFAEFYRDMFAEQVRRERMGAVFLEYAWDMSWCDPCAADPLSDRELRQLGVFWVGNSTPRPVRPPRPRPRPIPLKEPARDVFITRLHMRYTDRSFTEDLVFRETRDRENLQSRYVIRHPWQGERVCPAAWDYYRDLDRRREREAENLARLTGWDLRDIRRRQGDAPRPERERPWWMDLWDDDEPGGR